MAKAAAKQNSVARGSSLRLTALLGAAAIFLPACSLASLPANYSPIERQTAQELAPSNYAPRSAQEREAIATQDLFAQTAFWSREYDLNPGDLEAAINLSANLRRMGNTQKSIEVAQHTRALYPRDAALMTELGASLIANNQSRDALAVIDKALAQTPGNARLWSMKGAAFDQLEQYGAAREYYSRALSLAPNDPSILANVGLSYALEGDPKTAEIWLRRASDLPGASPSVRQNLALVLGLQGKTNEAERWAAQDLDQAGAASNLAYIQSLRGASSPQTPQTYSQPTLPARPQASSTYQKPQPYKPQNTPRVYGGQTQVQSPARSQSHSYAAPMRQMAGAPKTSQNEPGRRLLIAGEPGQDGVPKTAMEAARQAARQAAARRDQQAGQTYRLYEASPTAQAQPQVYAPRQQAAPNPQTSVLEKIAQSNQSKALLAQQQKAANAKRAAAAQAQYQAQYQGQHQARQPD